MELLENSVKSNEEIKLTMKGIKNKENEEIYSCGSNPPLWAE